MNTALKWVNLFTARFRVNTALQWVNLFTAQFQVNTALQWVNLFTAHLQVNTVNTALKWVNLPAAHVWVVEFVDYAAHVWVFEFVDHSTAYAEFMVPFAAHVLNFEHVNETVRPQAIFPKALVIELLLQAEFSGMVESMDYTVTDVNFQMREFFDLMCLYPCYATMHLLQGGPILMKSQNMIQRASTMKYDIVDYPFFMLHTKHCTFFLVLINL